MSEGEKARVRTGRPPVITMIRATKRSAKKRAGGGEERIVQRRSTASASPQNGGRQERGRKALLQQYSLHLSTFDSLILDT
jgi:hypothetical protein